MTRRHITGHAQHQDGRRFGAGFSLVEVTVAIAVVALVVVATSVLLQRLPVGGREVRDQDLALKIASEEVEILRAGGYDALPVSGSFSHPQLGSLREGAASLVIDDSNAKTKQVAVTVSWQGAVGARAVSLTTLVSQNSGLP